MNHFHRVCQQSYPYLAKSVLSLALLGSLSNCTMGETITYDAYDSPSQIEDRGDIIMSYEETDDEVWANIRTALIETEFYDDLARDLNEMLVFPRDITVVFTTCDEANAYYDPNAVTITMCYELIDEFLSIFTENSETEEDFAYAVIDASLFTFFHELGHALVDLYELPIIGKEEDAVDTFATIILLDVYEDDAGALSGMFQFEAEAAEEAENLESLPFWGEHALSSQRFYDTACLIYGSDRQEFSFLLEEGYLPEERAEICEEEYEQKSEAWGTLLEPFWK